MLNRDGVRTTTTVAPKQILANVELQSSVGCRIPQTLGVTIGGHTIAPAGTPINIDLTDLSAPVKAVGQDAPMNAVLLHDVDVTTDTANGTALIFGFVNLNRVSADVKTALGTAKAAAGASPLITLLNV